MLVVRHKSLGCNRIMKIIKKSDASNELTEAAVLRNLKSPCIPILYDLYSDEEYYYLVEELVQGESLAEYILHHAISPEQIINFAIMLCGVLDLMHSQQPDPILYQDMKPEHIIICGDTIKLIDYGIACFLSHSGKTFQAYGTKSFASPEQLSSGLVDEKSDIYSLGRVLLLMKNHSESRLSSREESLIEWALSQDARLRPASAAEYMAAWEEVRQIRDAQRKKKSSLLNSIAVVGNARGVGTTHIAISLTVYLREAGIKAFYKNESENETTECMLQNAEFFNSRENIIYHRSFYGIREMGPGLAPTKPPSGLYVIDAGCNIKLAEKADMILYIGSSRIWKKCRFEKEVLSNSHTYILINPATPLLCSRVAKQTGRRVFGFPNDSDAFSLSKQKKSVFERILKNEKKA